MTEENIYDDISRIDLGNTVTELEQRNKSLLENINVLQNDVKKLCEELTQMKKTEENLKKNISELYSTAKLEVQRKDRTIADLRREVDDLLFRRNKEHATFSHNKTENDHNKRKRGSSHESNKKSKTEPHHGYQSYNKSHSRSPSRKERTEPASRSNRSRSRDKTDRYHGHGSKSKSYHDKYKKSLREDKVEYSRSKHSADRYTKYHVNERVTNKDVGNNHSIADTSIKQSTSKQKEELETNSNIQSGKIDMKDLKMNVNIELKTVKADKTLNGNKIETEKCNVTETGGSVCVLQEDITSSNLEQDKSVQESDINLSANGSDRDNNNDSITLYSRRRRCRVKLE